MAGGGVGATSKEKAARVAVASGPLLGGRELFQRDEQVAQDGFQPSQPGGMLASARFGQGASTSTASSQLVCARVVFRPG